MHRNHSSRAAGHGLRDQRQGRQGPACSSAAYHCQALQTLTTTLHAEALQLAGVDYLVLGSTVLSSLGSTATMAGCEIRAMPSPHPQAVKSWLASHHLWQVQ